MGTTLGRIRYTRTCEDVVGMSPDPWGRRGDASTTLGPARTPSGCVRINEDDVGTPSGCNRITRTCEDTFRMSPGPPDQWGRCVDASATPWTARTPWGCLRDLRINGRVGVQDASASPGRVRTPWGCFRDLQIHGDDVGPHRPHPDLRRGLRDVSGSMWTTWGLCWDSAA